MAYKITAYTKSQAKKLGVVVIGEEEFFEKMSV